jgi:soluble lytic murein transglycosylase-like protein
MWWYRPKGLLGKLASMTLRYRWLNAPSIRFVLSMALCASAWAQPSPTAPPVRSQVNDLSPAQLCEGARRGDPELSYALGWLYTSGKGVEKNDGYAAYLFFAASSAGHPGAKRMLSNMTWPAAELPKCMEASAESRYLPSSGPVAVLAPPEIASVVQRLAPRYSLDPKLVLAIISVESNFNKFALSPKDAMGLMQLIPKTADRFKVDKPFDVTQNIMGGMAYLRWLLAYFEGDLVLVTAAYNAGEHNVDKYLGVPPFAETQDYVRKVLARVGMVQHPFDAKAAKPSILLPLMGKSADKK